MNLTFDLKTKERLDKFLTEQLTGQSRSQIKKLIQAGLVTVNDKPAAVHHWLRLGDKIVIGKAAERVTKKLAPLPEIIFQDQDFLVISKPAGLLVQPTAREKITLISWLLKHYPLVKEFGDSQRPGLVHRLDRDVSGLMVIALSKKAYESLKKQFQERSVDKKYLALVHGRVSNDDGRITSRLDKDSQTGLMKALTAKDQKEQGRPAVTHYRVLKRFLNYSLLEVKIITGRTHQIRAHLQSIGHSIVGDPLYLTKDIKKKKKTYLNRPFLHAYQLTFHDLEGKGRQYYSPLPEQLNDYLKALK